MDDNEIIKLFLNGDQRAIEECRQKYGSAILKICTNITRSSEDAEECLNDTLMAAWQSIGKTTPKSLGSFLKQIGRNLALDAYRRRNAEKRGLCVCIEELGELESKCFPADEELDKKELDRLIDVWLSGLPKEKRIVFVRRYFYMDEIKEISKLLELKENTVKSTLLRLRKSLKKYLSDNGVCI